TATNARKEAEVARQAADVARQQAEASNRQAEASNQQAKASNQQLQQLQEMLALMQASTGSQSQAGQKLLAIVPTADHCTPSNTGQNAVASVECSPGVDGVSSVGYTLFPDQAALDR